MRTRTAQESAVYYNGAARRSDARYRFVCKKLLSWAKRNHPRLLKTLQKQAWKKVPKLIRNK